jgi:hypothetical protein
MNAPILSATASLLFFAPACSGNSPGGPGSPDGSVDSGNSAPPDDGSNASADGSLSDDGSNGMHDGSAAATDCTKAQGYCISANVVRGGTRLNCTATSAALGNVSRLTVGTPSWTVGCDDPAHELSASVNFPVQMAGPFDYSATPGGGAAIKFSAGPFNLSQGATTGSMTESSTNLVSGRLSGTVDATLMGTGTLTASWAKPGGGCTSGDLSNPCAEGSLTLTFHVPLPR